MKNLLTLILSRGGVCSAVLLGATTQAQDFGIDWLTIDGGGGVSAGSGYSITGTIGQPEAATMSRGRFTVRGGFWHLASDCAPLLRIEPGAPGFLVLQWSPDCAGFILESTPTLASPAWTKEPSGSTNIVAIPLAGASKFYRLTSSGQP